MGAATFARADRGCEEIANYAFGQSCAVCDVVSQSLLTAPLNLGMIFDPTRPAHYAFVQWTATWPSSFSYPTLGYLPVTSTLQLGHLEVPLWRGQLDLP